MRDELTEKDIYSEFRIAADEKANKGEDDKDILDALTKDKEKNTFGRILWQLFRPFMEEAVRLCKSD